MVGSGEYCVCGQNQVEVKSFQGDANGLVISSTCHLSRFAAILESLAIRFFCSPQDFRFFTLLRSHLEERRVGRGG